MAANTMTAGTLATQEARDSTAMKFAWIITLRPRQHGRNFADDIFMCIFFNENCCILIKFSLKYVRKRSIENNPALVEIMTWRRSGDKPLSQPMMNSLPTHIYMRHSASMC